MSIISTFANIFSIGFSILIFDYVTFKSAKCSEQCPRMDMGILLTHLYCNDTKYTEITFKDLFIVLIIIHVGTVITSYCSIWKSQYFAIMHSILTIIMISELSVGLFSPPFASLNGKKCETISNIGFQKTHLGLSIVVIGWYIILLGYDFILSRRYLHTEFKI